MGIKVMKQGTGYGKYKKMEFLCDTAEDVANLPTDCDTGTCGKLCAAGSTALIADTKEIKVLNTQGEWV